MNSKIRTVAFVLVLITVVSSIIYLQNLSGTPIVSGGFEFVGISNWINSEPLTMQSLRGKVVLVDFWTYSCINCIRTLPYIVAWNDKYSEHGLVIVGVHSPEFAFEKKLDNVKDAVQKFGIKYPIALDNDHLTFSGFGNRFWPHKYLFDAKGNLRYDHIGEGGYEETERQIQKLLAESGAKISIPIEPENKYVNVDLGGAVAGMTRELYAVRDVINTDAPNIAGRKATYKDEGNHRTDGIYLDGEWTTNVDHMLHAGKMGSFVIAYSGRTASPVIGSPSGQKFTAKVLLDGNTVPKESAGQDLKFDQNGSSYVKIDGPPRLYSLVNAKIPFGKHEIKVETNAGLAIWSVTFGA
ncbi:MAG: thioredoxin family protein [Thaumarchaeota archaeon]|nr:thioredoxin family protein [Nitrososphaerota archaeon]